MGNRDIPTDISRISQTELDLVSSQRDSCDAQLPLCEEVPVWERDWVKPPEVVCVETEVVNYLEPEPNVCEGVSEGCDDNEVEECPEGEDSSYADNNQLLTASGEIKRFLKSQPHRDSRLAQFDKDQFNKILKYDVSDPLVEGDVDETIYEDSYGLGAQHDPIVRGDCLDARISNTNLIQNEFEKRYINNPYPEDEPGVKRVNLPPAQRKAFNLKRFQQQYPNTPGSVPKLPENRANFSLDLSTTPNPIGKVDRRQSMPEEFNAIYAGMERQRRMKADRDRAEEELLELFDQQREEIGKTDCEADEKGLAYPCEPQQRSPYDRQYTHNRVIKPSRDLPVGPTIRVQDRKHLVVPGVNQKPGSRLRTHPDEVICNEDQNSSAESYSTLNEAFRGGPIPGSDLTYTIDNSPADHIWTYCGSSHVPPQPCRRRSSEHSKGSPVSSISPTWPKRSPEDSKGSHVRSQVSRLSPTCPRDSSPRGIPAQIRRTPKRPEGVPARPRFPEIRQQVQTFFDNRKEPPTSRGLQMCPRVRFEEPQVAELLFPRARGIVPANVIQTGVYHCGINNVAYYPPCVPQREKGSLPTSKRAPSKRPLIKYPLNKCPPFKRPPIKRPPIKRPPIKRPLCKLSPDKPPTPPWPRAGGDPIKRIQNLPGLPNVPRPWTEPIPKKKKDFKLTEEQKALVLDNYYPGLIHDAVNQNADFNEVAQKFVTPESKVDGDKAEKGMSLLEAFDTRVKFEQISTRSLLTTTGGNKGKNVPPPYQHAYGASANPITHDIIREDDVRPTAIIDLQQFVRSTPESDPVRAITCLTRAQHLNDYYKEYRAAQLAVQTAPPDKIEQAALFGVRQFQIDSLSSDSKTVHSECYKCLELVSYVGVTKPN